MALAIRPADPDDREAVWAMLEPVFRAGTTYAIDPSITREEALAYWYAARPFVAQDEDIVVHTETFEYSERA